MTVKEIAEMIGELIKEHGIEKVEYTIGSIFEAYKEMEIKNENC